MSFQPAPIPPAEMAIINGRKWGRFTSAQAGAFVSAWNAGVGTDVLVVALQTSPGALTNLARSLRQCGITLAKRLTGRPPKPAAERPLTGQQKEVYDALLRRMDSDGLVTLSVTTLSADLGYPHTSSAGVAIKGLIARGLIVKHAANAGSGSIYGKPGSVLPERSEPKARPVAVKDTFWTDEKVAQAKRLYVGDGFSASQVARRIGCTRGAVISKAKRLGWSSMRGPTVNRRNQSNGVSLTARQIERREARRNRPDAPRVESGLRVVEISHQPIGIFDLNKNTCRWPVDGEGADTRYCGAQAESDAEDAPYCAAHASIAFNPTPEYRPKVYDATVQRTRRIA